MIARGLVAMGLMLSPALGQEAAETGKEAVSGSDTILSSPAPQTQVPDAPKPLRVAVLDFAGRGGITRDEAIAITDRFRFLLLKTRAFDLMERNNMNLILEEQGVQQQDCFSQECAVQLGKLLAVRKIITGAVNKIGDIYAVAVNMLDVEQGRVDKSENEDCPYCSIERVYTDVLPKLAKRMAGGESAPDALEPLAGGGASLYVVTEPESAQVFLEGRLLGLAPNTFSNLPPGRHLIEARRGGLSARKEVDIFRRGTARVVLLLEKAKTVLEIRSEPQDAEVYLGRKPSHKTKPDYLTPATIEGLEGKTVTVSLFKAGWRDTSFLVELSPDRVNINTVALSPASVETVNKQKKMLRKRGLRKWGGYMSLSSLALLAGGGALYYLGYRDYRDAHEAKAALEQSTLRSGPQYDAMVRDNAEKSESGNNKTLAAAGVGVLGAALLSVGLILYF